MICKKCGYNMQEDSNFCMNCGTKVEKNSKVQQPVIDVQTIKGMTCPRCGKNNPVSSVYCLECGAKLKKSRTGRMAIGVLAVIIIVLAAACLFVVQRNNLRSPIEGVSKKVYEQGQEFLEKMNTSSVKDAVAQYVNSNSNAKMGEVYLHIEGVDFIVDVGKNATMEEAFYADLIVKFWASKANCYAHEALIAQYEESDEAAVQMVAALYKGIVSDFEDSIDEAEEVLKTASTFEDMEKAYQILDDIWESGD